MSDEYIYIIMQHIKSETYTCPSFTTIHRIYKLEEEAFTELLSIIYKNNYRLNEDINYELIKYKINDKNNNNINFTIIYNSRYHEINQNNEIVQKNKLFSG